MILESMRGYSVQVRVMPTCDSHMLYGTFESDKDAVMAALEQLDACEPGGMVRVSTTDNEGEPRQVARMFR